MPFLKKSFYRRHRLSPSSIDVLDTFLSIPREPICPECVTTLSKTTPGIMALSMTTLFIRLKNGTLRIMIPETEYCYAERLLELLC